MDKTQAPSPHPALLEPGTVVGPWRVVAWASRGVHGAVYRAVRVGHELAEPVALKLALLPKDPRFAREVSLLSLMHHPSIPRLVDHGEWLHPSGSSHPYIVMEWVDGVPLYDWAQHHVPSPPQVFRMLAQLAGALQELHAQGGVHRDLKGDNILVRRSDGRAVLTDFGAGTYPKAATLTPPGRLTGTLAYLSPEAALLELNSLTNPSARHVSGPADDLYALGVTACRLLTGEYPEPADPLQDEHGVWHLRSVIVPPALFEVELRLRSFIVRLLSVRPEKRGTAAQLVQALKHVSELCLTDSPRPPLAQPPPPAQRPWLATTAAVLALAAWVWWLTPGAPVQRPSIVKREAGSASQKDGGTSGLGEAASTTSVEDSPPVFIQDGMAEDPLPEPVEGQATPDAKGRCPRKGQVALNDGCWGPVNVDREKCEDLSGQMFKGICYVPVLPPGRRQPTSHPSRKQ
jgi:serine/threonine protein kinase